MQTAEFKSRNREGLSSSRNTQYATRSRSGFTMIEIAISLAVIAFALVAIVGVLPIGMNVQRDNRQETIINQDATVLMDAISHGERGLDDLTNYVIAITNYVTQYTPQGKPTTPKPSEYGYTYTTSTYNPGGAGTPSATSPLFPLTNGFHIVGLLSTPKFTPVPGNPASTYSNHVVAWLRSLSGPASEKVQHPSGSVLALSQELGLTYKLILDVAPYSTNYFDPLWTNWTPQVVGNNTNLMLARSNYWVLTKQLQTNLHDLRLTFRWPLLANGNTGPGRQIYRTTIGGYIVNTNDPNYPAPNTLSNMYFFQPRTYVKAP